MIQLTLIYSTNAIVSRFANDILVAYDSLFFIPTLEHVDQCVTVLIQPIKNRNMEMEMNMETYRFSK